MVTGLEVLIVERVNDIGSEECVEECSKQTTAGINE